MIALLVLTVLAVLAVAGVTGSIVAVARDGYRPIPTRASTDRIRPA